MYLYISKENNFLLVSQHNLFLNTKHIADQGNGAPVTIYCTLKTDIDVSLAFMRWLKCLFLCCSYTPQYVNCFLNSNSYYYSNANW